MECYQLLSFTRYIENISNKRAQINKSGDTCLVVKVLSPLSEGISPPFLSLFVLMFHPSGNGGGSGDIFA
jgi:hypothetical protein